MEGKYTTWERRVNCITVGLGNMDLILAYAGRFVYNIAMSSNKKVKKDSSVE